MLRSGRGQFWNASFCPNLELKPGENTRHRRQTRSAHRSSCAAPVRTVEPLFRERDSKHAYFPYEAFLALSRLIRSDK